MTKEGLKVFINIKKEEYKKIGKIYCPYLNKDVCLNISGFYHLIWKSEMSKRTSIDIEDRLNSIIFIESIISKSGTLQEIEKRDNKTFYAFIAIVDNKKYKVVVSDTKDGRIIFNSIIPKWKTSSRDVDVHLINAL